MSLTILGYTISWPLVGTLVALLIGREIWNLTYFKRRGIPGPTPLPLLGNAMCLNKGLHTYMLECQEKYGRIFGIYMFREPILCVADPDMIKDVTVKNFSKFVNHKPFFLKNRPFDKGLSLLRDDHWKSIRSIISPTFSALKMKQMSSLINECSDSLVENFEEIQKRDGQVNVVPVFEAFTMDGIAKCAFGLQVNSQKNPNDPFVKNAKVIMDGDLFSPTLVLSGIVPGFARLMDFLHVGMFPQSVIDFFNSVIQKAMNMRKDVSSSKRKDFLQLLMNAHEDEEHEGKGKSDDHDLHNMVEEHQNDQHLQELKTTTKKKLNLEEIMAQALLFFVAGYETTNTTLGFIAYSLATNPDVQDKLIAEVDEVTPTRDSVHYGTVAKMPYLDAVVCETLRLYPFAALSDRECNEDYTYNGVSVTKGVQIFYSIFGVQRNPELWPEPENFDPTRFTKENRDGRHPFAWVPFGAGPRNCIGMRFALMEIKMGVARILQKYRFEVSPKTQVPVELGTRSVKPKEGIFLKLIERN